MAKLLVFAGTTEGRELAQALCRHGFEVVASTATEYGAQLFPESDGLTVWPHRMTEQQMTDRLLDEPFEAVIDATHPYAQEATRNIRNACLKAGVPYYRLVREEEAAEDAVYLSSSREAAEYLAGTSGAVFLTTGTKELKLFSVLPDFAERFYARVLPFEESIRACTECGLTGKHIFAMQGPFSREMNRAMLSQTEAAYLVTKSSGKAGGFSEKLQAAKELGVTVLVIGRPEQEEGYSLPELLARFGIEEPCREEKQDYFPFYLPVRNQRVLIVGAGRIACRRIKTLSRFSCRLIVRALAVPEEIRELAEEWQESAFEVSECNGMDYVLAATDDPQLNHEIVSYCRKRKIPVNRVDSKEECDFYFPAVIVEEPLVVSVCAGGKGHHQVKRAADYFRRTARLWKERER